MVLRQLTGPSHTLLLVMPCLVARIDFVGRRKPRVSRLWFQPTGNASRNGSSAAWQLSLTSAVAQGLKLGPNRLGKVSIACPNLWTDVYQLSSDVVSLATPSEIRQALAIEAEIESGISPFECLVACHPLESDDRGVHFLFTQISSSLVAELRKVIQSCGSKLVRLSHPIGLELTGDSLSSHKVLGELKVWNTRCSGDDLIFPAADPSQPQPVSVDPMQQFLEEFGERWGRLLALPASCVPLAIDLQAGSQSTRDLVVSCILAAATVSGVTAWHSATRRECVSASRSIQQLEQQQNQHNEVLAETQKLKTHLVRLRKQTQAAEEYRRTVERQLHLARVLAQRSNTRWSHLLESLADFSGDCWIQRIESTGRVTKLIGIAPSIAQAHAFAAKLACAVQGNGWSVAPADTRQLPSSLIEFSIALTQDFDATDSSEDSREIVCSPVSNDSRILPIEANLEDSQS